MESERRHLRNYLLDHKYQLRYTVIMAVISALLTSGLGYVWYKQVRETSQTIEVKALGSMSESEVQTLEREIQRQDFQRLLVLVAFGVAFIIVVTGYGIVLTHKVAGPLFKMTRYMQDMREGKLAPISDIRKGDHLHDFFGVFRDLHAALRSREQREVELLGQAIQTAERHVESVGDAAPAELRRSLDTLRELRVAKERSLQG